MYLCMYVCMYVCINMQTEAMYIYLKTYAFSNSEKFLTLTIAER